MKTYSFFTNMVDRMWDKYNRNSLGYMRDPIAVVYPRIYLGSVYSITPEVFQRYNISHAINCSVPEFDSKWFKETHPDKDECMNAEDTLDFDITTVYPKFEETLNRFLSDKNSRNIYIHCQCGINRSAFLCLLYMCVKYQYRLDNMVSHILRQRPCCLKNPSFRKQVTDYIKKLE